MEIKIKGDYYTERSEMLSVAHAGDLTSIIHDVSSEIRNRQKHCDNLTDDEYAFLSKIQELLYVGWME